jgi:hypothetical protein
MQDTWQHAPVTTVRRGLAAVGVLAVLAGCSSDADSDPGDDPAPSGAATSSAVPVDESVVRTDLADLFTGSDGAGTRPADGTCFADALLERVPVEDLVAAGLVDSSGRVPDALPTLDAALAEQWVDAQASCVDYVAASTAALQAQSKGRLDAASYRRCLRTALSPAELREAQVQALSGGMGGPAVADLADAQSACAIRALPRD